MAGDDRTTRIIIAVAVFLILGLVVLALWIVQDYDRVETQPKPPRFDSPPRSKVDESLKIPSGGHVVPPDNATKGDETELNK